MPILFINCPFGTGTGTGTSTSTGIGIGIGTVSRLAIRGVPRQWCASRCS